MLGLMSAPDSVQRYRASFTLLRADILNVISATLMMRTPGSWRVTLSFRRRTQLRLSSMMPMGIAESL